MVAASEPRLPTIRTVAVIGASRSPGKIGHVVLRNLIESGFKGEIVPINPYIDKLLGKQWNKKTGEFAQPVLANENAGLVSEETIQATCSCGSGIPVQKLMINGQSVTLVALPVMLQQFKETGKAPDPATITELLDLLKVYNPVPVGEVPAYREALLQEYTAYFEKEPVQ